MISRVLTTQLRPLYLLPRHSADRPAFGYLGDEMFVGVDHVLFLRDIARTCFLCVFDLSAPAEGASALHSG